jgi:FkbM family methyltransferase
MNFDALAYRVYFAARDLGMSGLLRRFPRMGRNVKRLTGWVLPQTPVWVEIQSGISRGMWMRLSLPGEARLWRGEHETAVQEAILAAICPGVVVYDIGAHTGSISLGVARLVGRSGRVVAFEADPKNVESLRENCSRNNLTASLQVVPSAVWSHTALDIPFRCGGAQGMHGGVETDGQRPVLGSGEVIHVPGIALDDFIASGGPMPQLIKIDVEGGECEVLRGGTNFFANGRPLIIVEVHHSRAADQIDAWLTEHQYCGKWTIPNESFPRCLFAWPEEYDGAAWMARSTRHSRPNCRQ